MSSPPVVFPPCPELDKDLISTARGFGCIFLRKVKSDVVDDWISLVGGLADRKNEIQEKMRMENSTILLSQPSVSASMIVVSDEAQHRTDDRVSNESRSAESSPPTVGNKKRAGDNLSSSLPDHHVDKKSKGDIVTDGVLHQLPTAVVDTGELLDEKGNNEDERCS